MTFASITHLSVMDFNKIFKIKDGVLSEKEYKCASLQAITNEAIKENNKKRLKTLVEEINGHLLELRGLKSDQNHDRCQKLIEQFEEILVKIATPTPRFPTLIANQLQELQTLVDAALKNNNQEELTKLAERIERNVEILMEIPEVKSAKSGDKDQEGVLEVTNKYTTLLNRVLAHVNGSSKVEDSKKIINEVEEKLKLMRQKRLNRLSNFVDEQSKLSLDRSRNKSLEDLTELEPGLKRGGTLTRSFAERQIDIARNQQLSRPLQRNPTQIQKIFNTFNACVQGVADDVPRGLTNLEKELKSVTLKSWRSEEVKKDKQEQVIKFQLKTTGLGRWTNQEPTSTDHLESSFSKIQEEVYKFTGLKRDSKYTTISGELSQFLARVDQLPSSFDQVEKRMLLQRVKNVEEELQQRAERNEDMMRMVFEEVVAMIGDKHKMTC